MKPAVAQRTSSNSWAEQLKPRRIEIGGVVAKAAKQENQTKQIDASAKKVA
jgi:hypothetical protein